MVPNDLHQEAEHEAERPFWPAVRTGWRRRCPNCGKGHLLKGYLTVNPTCEYCGLDLSKARADDGPAYVTILVMGHISVVAMLEVFVLFRPEPWIMALGFIVVTALMSLWMLPRVKGAFIGLQWAKRMHGF
ncbi:MAG: hypothetical protein COW55_16060 [Rhodobacteraceae bacterium CG17_big_fil_post_rev_8_21_14_2_50_65_11]|nr:MAG: hypothetical protein COW55_16060 [Rhodobacteraceae bacterium CG17_big_fil_post_rev_8_21_14_2_50_65_11]